MWLCGLLYLFFRAFGDKSCPPSLPDAEDEGEEVNGDECEDDVEEVGVEDRKEEAERHVEEEQSARETVTDQVCTGVEELKLAEQKEEEGEKGNEEDEENISDQKTPQGTRRSQISHYVY